jgi:hypothetical protein
MIVYLTPELFTREDGVSPLALFALWHHGSLGRHIVQIAPDARQVFEAWLAMWPEEHALRLEIQRAEEQNSHAIMGEPRPALVVEVCAGDTQEDQWDISPSRLRLCLKTTLRLMERPLQLLVENQHSDGAFLLALHKMLMRWGQEELHELFAELRQRRDVVFTQGGGIAEVTKALDAIREQGDQVGLWRSWVMVDHDGKTRATCSENTRDVQRAARRCHVPCHVLKRRMIENYAPKDGISFMIQKETNQDRREELVAKLDVYCALEEEARHFYHLKEGMKKSDGGLIDVALHNALKTGFGNKMVAQVFEAENFDEAWLAADDEVRDEAVAIFESILGRR